MRYISQVVGDPQRILDLQFRPYSVHLLNIIDLSVISIIIVLIYYIQLIMLSTRHKEEKRMQLFNRRRGGRLYHWVGMEQVRNVTFDNTEKF